MIIIDTKSDIKRIQRLKDQNPQSLKLQIKRKRSAVEAKKIGTMKANLMKKVAEIIENTHIKRKVKRVRKEREVDRGVEDMK